MRSFIAALLTLVASQATAQRLILDPAASRIWFEASASMGGFRGTAERFSGWAQVSDTISWSDAAGRVEVDAGSFGTGIALRNRHLRAHLQAERFPRILFTLERAERRGEQGIILFGTLTIHGVTRTVEIPAAITENRPLILDGALQTRFTDWGMSPPSQLGGLARVRDPITLHFHAVFHPRELDR